MAFTTGPTMMDAIVLSVVGKEQEGTYGYKITQDVRSVLEVSESTLYPVLRRLQKDGCLETYDREFGGRNRRYYKITPTGTQRLAEHLKEWEEYRARMEQVFYGENEV
ncbi:MAG: PadR family transcriptional regulator [Pygmaiobacter sp.]